MIYILTFLSLLTLTIYERVTHGSAPWYIVWPTLLMIPFMLFSLEDMKNRYKKVKIISKK